jgi:UDP-N-acetylmuramate dehydrogenase
MIEKEKFELKNYNTFRMESIADVVYFPENIDEFVELLKKVQHPKIMGAASNVLFGILGVKEPLIFTSHLDKITLEDDVLDVECGVKSPFLANFALANSITGFEFLAQIPSYIGGNIWMNASAHEQCISDNLISCRIFDILKKEDRVIEKTVCILNTEALYLKSIQTAALF